MRFNITSTKALWVIVILFLLVMNQALLSIRFLYFDNMKLTLAYLVLAFVFFVANLFVGYKYGANIFLAISLSCAIFLVSFNFDFAPLFNLLSATNPELSALAETIPAPFGRLVDILFFPVLFFVTYWVSGVGARKLALSQL